MGQYQPKDPKLSSAAEELLYTPQPKPLGTVKLSNLQKAMQDDPPPWEQADVKRFRPSDVRRFVDIPDDWEVRWLSPRLVDQYGLRYWRAVPADHEGITLKVPSMHAPDNTIRKANHTNGPFLAYMPKHWVASRQRLKEEEVVKRTAAAMRRVGDTIEQVNRGAYGPFVHVDRFRHPTHTTGDGRTMTD